MMPSSMTPLYWLIATNLAHTIFITQMGEFSLIPFDANATTTVSEVRAFMQAYSGQTHGQILYAGNALNENALLSDYGIGSQSILEYHPRKMTQLKGWINLIRTNCYQILLTFSRNSKISIPVSYGNKYFFADASLQIKACLKNVTIAKNMTQIEIREALPILFVFRDGNNFKKSRSLLSECDQSIFDDTFRNAKVVNEHGGVYEVLRDDYWRTDVVLQNIGLQSYFDAVVWYPREPSLVFVSHETYAEDFYVFIVDLESEAFADPFEHESMVNNDGYLAELKKKKQKRRCAIS